MRVSDEFEQALSKFRQVLRTGCWTLVNCGAAKYRCEAFKEGKSCFEHPLTPCCDVNRKRCISCPVFIRLVELPKRPQRVLITTDHLRIEADFHCPVGMRILDALNVEERNFIALTDARVSGLGAGGAPPADGEEREVPFIAVSRDSIRALVPLTGDAEDEPEAVQDAQALAAVLSARQAAPAAESD